MTVCHKTGRSIHILTREIRSF